MLERVLRSIERLDVATSLRAALDVLADAVSSEAPRSLVWVVRGDRLRGWRASGASSAPADFDRLDIALPAAGPFASAVASRQPVSLHANALAADTDAALSWLDLADDQAGLVVPVTVDDHVVALVYADDGASPDRDVPGSWPESVQVLARHAARVLEVLTARRAAGARVAPAPGHAPAASANAPMTPDEARQFARLVVSEVRRYSERSMKAGRGARDLRMRLAEPIARARRAYDERVPASLAGRDEVFEQELRRTLAEGDRGPARRARRRHGLIGVPTRNAVEVARPRTSHETRRCAAVGVRVSRPGDGVPGAASPADRHRRPRRGRDVYTAGLVPTEHPPIPATWAETWLVPEPGSRPSDVSKVFAQGVRLYEAGSFAGAFASFDDPRLASTPLAAYARFYSALASRQLQRPDEARVRLEAVRTLAGDSVVAERAALAAADLAEASGDPARAAQLYDEVLRRAEAGGTGPGAGGTDPRRRSPLETVSAPTRLRCGSTTSSRRVRRRAQRPTSWPRRGSRPMPLVPTEFFKRDLGRGERLFSARLWSDARLTFEGLRSRATGDDLELIDLRIAECDQHTGRHRAAADRLAPYLDAASRKAEAQFFYLLALRGLGQADQFVARAWALDADFPSSTWAADALNHLASFFLVAGPRRRGAGGVREGAERPPHEPARRTGRVEARVVAVSAKGAFAEAAETSNAAP